jgi:D-alanyl-D-alanine carboxypeptidase/D-alanyl-D-alanine-endopeptidase (penicillin-binding protein 4)
MVPINTWSNNACADQLFLALGHAHGGAGTREGGARATRAALDRLGVSSAGLVQVDGSGLSRDNRVSAAQITALIEAVLRRGGKTAIAYVDSLAVAGMSGTLEHRTTKGNLRAKTGFIAGTSALSGLVESADGRTLVFSILVDYPRFEGLNRSCWKPMEDEIVSALANSKE